MILIWGVEVISLMSSQVLELCQTPQQVERIGFKLTLNWFK